MAITSMLQLLFIAAPDNPLAPGGGEGGDGASVTAEREALDALLPRLVERFVAALCQQLSEKIDRMREVAGETLRKLLRHQSLPDYPHRAALVSLLLDAPQDQLPAPPLPALAGGSATPLNVTPPSDGSTASEMAAGMAAVNVFISPQLCFPLAIRLLELPGYRKDALRGLCVSVGGLSESTNKA